MGKSSRGAAATVDGRATTPMVGKSLEAAIVVLFIGVMTTGLYAGVVPDYRSGTAAEVGDRTLVAAGNEVEAAVPPDAARVSAERRVALPATIRSEEYRIVAVEADAHGNDAAGSHGNDAADSHGNDAADSHGNDAANDTDDTIAATGHHRLELRHPHHSVGGTRALALPDHVVAVRGEIRGGDGSITIEGSPDGEGIVVVLEDGP